MTTEAVALFKQQNQAHQKLSSARDSMQLGGADIQINSPQFMEEEQDDPRDSLT